MCRCRVPIILNFCKPDGFRQSGRVVCRCRVPIINNREIRAAALGTSLEVIWPPTGYDHNDGDFLNMYFINLNINLQHKL